MHKISINKTVISFRSALPTLLFITTNSVQTQEYRGTLLLTFHPLLQGLGMKLIQGKKGSIVTIDSVTGEVLCMVTNSSTGPNDALATATAYPPDLAIKPAQALIFLSGGIVKPDTKIACHDGFHDGNIKMKCYPYYSPEAPVGALAISCSTWFLKSYLSMLDNTQKCDSKEKAVAIWWEYIIGMGLGGPLNIDMVGGKGGSVANVSYPSRRYKNSWDSKTIIWAGMGQGNIIATPLQLYNLAVTTANRDCFSIPHTHKGVDWASLPSRFLVPRQTKAPPYIYTDVIKGVHLAVAKGIATILNRTAYPICGKTGITENAGKDHSILIGSTPMNEPKITILIYIEHGGFGADAAASIVGLTVGRYLKGKLSSKSQAMAKRIGRTNTMDK